MTLNDYQDIAEGFTEPYFNSVDCSALALGEEAGEVLGKIKKWGRDASYSPHAEQRMAVRPELGDVLWCIAHLAAQCGWTLEDVAACNIRKLTDRRARGVLHGEGDER